jgi:hypothetical protein
LEALVEVVALSVMVLEGIAPVSAVTLVTLEAVDVSAVSMMLSPAAGPRTALTLVSTTALA